MENTTPVLPRVTGVRIERLSPAHEDARRVLVEFVDSPLPTDPAFRCARVMQVQEPHGAPSTLGGHWEEGREVLYVLSGEIAALQVANLTTGEEEVYYQLPACTRISLESGIAHQLTFTHAATIVALNEAVYTPSRMHDYTAFKKPVVVGGTD